MIEWMSFALIAGGISFIMIGSVALLRLPDLYSRLHALTKVDNLGLGLLCGGLALLDGGAINAIKLLLVWLLVLGASATSAHLIAQQARRREQQ